MSLRAGTRAPAPVLALHNQCWTLDFAHDQLVMVRRFRVLDIVDDVTRECIRAGVDTSISGRRVVREPRSARIWSRHRALRLERRGGHRSMTQPGRSSRTVGRRCYFRLSPDPIPAGR